MLAFQSVGAKRVDRKSHVWLDLLDGRWKCVLCGGVTKKPTDGQLPETFEALTDRERAMAPREKGVW